jgi:chemotaxis protein MotB
MISSRNRLKTGNEGWLTSYADLITNLLIFFVLIISASQIQSGKLSKIAASLGSDSNPKSLVSAAENISKFINEERLNQQVSAKLTDAGLELSFDSGVMFLSGNANILPPMEEPLEKVLLKLRDYVGKYQVAVEGHTDEIPIHTREYKSNWELSSARAMQVRERLEKIGFEKSSIRVEAYADTKPIAEKESTPDGVRAKKRRVVVRLY